MITDEKFEQWFYGGVDNLFSSRAEYFYQDMALDTIDLKDNQYRRAKEWLRAAFEDAYMMGKQDANKNNA
jgi:hypothetical protein